MPERRSHERLKYGPRVVGSALEFRMVLYAYIERMIGELDGFNKVVLRIAPADNKSESRKFRAVCVIELKAVTMTFIYRRRAAVNA